MKKLKIKLTKFISLALIATFLLSSNVFATTTIENNDVEEVKYGTVVIVDMEGNVISEKDLAMSIVAGNLVSNVIRPRQFPCCRNYPNSGLSKRMAYSHVPDGNTCYSSSFLMATCNSCGYTDMHWSNTTNLGTHSLTNEKGKWHCPY